MKMKLKTILGVLFAAVATFAMSVAVSAATDVKVGDYGSEDGFTYVPIEIQSTDIDAVGSYDIIVTYDANKYTDFYDVIDLLTYTKGRNEKYIGSMNYADTPGRVHIVWAYNNPDDASATLVDGKIPIVELDFDAEIADINPSDFTITVGEINDEAEKKWFANSYFKFDVAGDLGGNEVVAVYAAINGENPQPLEYYYDTDFFNEGVEMDKATTTFVVNINNTKGAAETVDIEIYGETEDGTKVPLTYLEDFKIQNFGNVTVIG